MTSVKVDYWCMFYALPESKQAISIALYNAKLISKALRYDPCVTRDHTVLPATHTRTIPAFTPQPQSITALWHRYQLVLLGEQRHTGVRNMPRVFTPRARPRLEPTTS